MTKDGATIYVELSAVVVKDPADEPTGVLCIARDITARRAEERVRQERLTELEEMVRRLGGEP